MSDRLASVQRTCVFCGGGSLTKEHLWPRWAQSLLPADTLIPIEHVVEVDGEQPTRRSFSAHGFAQTTRKVCATCNNGWMARLEEHAKPIIEAMARDEPVILDEGMQRVLATWAVKTAVVLDRAQGAPWRPTTMTAECRQLAQAGIPTSNVLVWLSGFLDPPPARARLWGTTANIVMTSGEGTTADIYGAIITLGAVCLQVIYIAVPDLPEAFAIEERPAINLIWPYRAPFHWSQRTSFADAGFEDLAAALPNLLRSTFNDMAGNSVVAR